MKLWAVRETHAVKFGVLGEDAQWNFALVMNARDIGDNFTSLVYIAVTSSVFLYKLPIKEGGA
jgi:hypothetical protein